jgi:DNA-binding Xre family transcriptional regulator
MRIALLLKKWRLINEIQVKELAAELGISKATMYRLESGGGIDGETLMKIFNWLTQEVEGGK